MLVLARRVGEVLRIGPDVTVTVCEIDGRTVRLGIDAPKAVPIVRAELPPYVKTRIEYRADASDPRPFAEGGAE